MLSVGCIPPSVDHGFAQASRFHMLAWDTSWWACRAHNKATAFVILVIQAHAPLQPNESTYRALA